MYYADLDIQPRTVFHDYRRRGSIFQEKGRCGFVAYLVTNAMVATMHSEDHN